MRERPKVYLAGPTVFFENAAEVGRLYVSICADHGLDGVFPSSNSRSARAGVKGGGTRSGQIFRGNLGLMDLCDALIADISPWRGVGADPGTAFEIGYMAANDKPIALFTDEPSDHFARVDAWQRARGGAALEASGGEARDMDGNLVENFGHADNLMLAECADLVERNFERATRQLAAKLRAMRRK